MSLRVACAQMNTRGDVADNVRVATELVEVAAAAGARLVALPETWAYKGDREGIVARAEAVDGQSNGALARLAARHGIFVLAGSIYEPAKSPGRVYNTSVLFGPDGGPRAVYRKIHLFDATAGASAYCESDDVTPGAELVTVQVDPCETAPGASAEPAAPLAPFTLGLTICYDLRFPELYRSLALRGAQVFCVPSAFTAYTGAAHWEVLLRARAVENGCFVIAPGQVGEHLPGRVCYGHTMVVDPWGTVLAQIQDGVGVCVADLDLARLAEVRRQLPSLQNRRPEAYDL